MPPIDAHHGMNGTWRICCRWSIWRYLFPPIIDYQIKWSGAIRCTTARKHRNKHTGCFDSQLEIFIPSANKSSNFGCHKRAEMNNLRSQSLIPNRTQFYLNYSVHYRFFNRIGILSDRIYSASRLKPIQKMGFTNRYPTVFTLGLLMGTSSV